jgi:hypothetical protein
MERMTIPKFENEADEANWLYENREGLSAAFHEAVQEGRVRQGTLKQRGVTPPTLQKSCHPERRSPRSAAAESRRTCVSIFSLLQRLRAPSILSS